jgi:hypothetical protein
MRTIVRTLWVAVAVVASSWCTSEAAVRTGPVSANVLPQSTAVPLPLPSIPDVDLPDVPLPTSVPVPVLPRVTVVPTPTVPEPVPAPKPDPPRASATPLAPASGASRQAAVAPASAPRSGGAQTRAVRPRTAQRRAASRPARRSSGARPGAARPGRGSRTPAPALPGGDAAPSKPQAAATPAHGPARPSSLPSRLGDDIGELIRALPAAVLWAILGIAGLAAGLAGNAFWQSRRREALETQRAALLDDIGLLSRALLPPVPDTPGDLAVSAAYRPADGPAAGGDFYDIFALDEDRTGILLGDVSGHGRESVTQAALARYTLRTLLAAGHSPGETLARADALLARDLTPNFVTVIAGIYDHATSEFSYAKAGHAPPIVLGAPHDPDAEPAVPPLALCLGDHWPEFCIELGDGAAVCLYTDGLEDAKVDGKRIGRDEVKRLLTAQEHPDAPTLISDLEKLADQLPDDTAALILSRPETTRAAGDPRGIAVAKA